MRLSQVLIGVIVGEVARYSVVTLALPTAAPAIRPFVFAELDWPFPNPVARFSATLNGVLILLEKYISYTNVFCVLLQMYLYCCYLCSSFLFFVLI